MPEVFERTDGRFLFYRSKVNVLLGKPEAGKSLVAQAAAVEAITAGGHVVYLDHESDVVSVAARLVALGADPDGLETRLHYQNPHGPFAGEEREVLLDYLDNLRPTLVIVDGLIAAMSAQGLEVNSNKDAATIFRDYLDPLCGCGAAEVLIHHLAKGSGEGATGLGATTLTALARGVHIGVTTEDKARHTPGKHGHSTLTILKDNDGGVRMFGRGGKFATFETSSVATGEDDAFGRPVFVTSWALKTPGEGLENGPTGCMEAVSRHLEGEGIPCAVATIEGAALGGDFTRNTRRWALKVLEDGGYVTRGTVEKGKAAGYSHAKAYRRPAEDALEWAPEDP